MFYCFEVNEHNIPKMIEVEKGVCTIQIRNALDTVKVTWKTLEEGGNGFHHNTYILFCLEL